METPEDKARGRIQANLEASVADADSQELPTLSTTDVMNWLMGNRQFIYWALGDLNASEAANKFHLTSVSSTEPTNG
jgi:hypothetical protein